MINTQEFYSDLWNKILQKLIQNNKSAENSKMEFIYAEDNKLYIDSFSEFRKGYYTNQYLKSLNEYLSEYSDEKLEIVFFINDKKIKKTVLQENNKNSISQNNIEETKIKQENMFSSIINSKKASFQYKDISNRRKESNLNERYTFDSFIMGDNTSLAYNVSYAISKEPGIAYNPCLIYGGVGLGKHTYYNQ